MEIDDGIRVFLVDDDALFLKLLETEFLQHGGFVVETYSSGESCIDNLSRNPDVVILDVHLNGIDKDAMDGIETLDKIKSFNSDIQVVMLSSQDEMDVALKCMHHHVHDYVLKSETAFMRLHQVIMTNLVTKKLKRR